MKNHKRYRRLLAGVLAGLLMTAGGPAHKAEAATAPGYIKAATYVSDAWVSNFWNSESDHMEEELARIAADGFNSIVLVVPWREFQPSIEPISYSSYPFQKLDQIMRAAGAQGLGVVFRVGYTWDYYSDDASNLRFRELLRNQATRAGWIDYARTLYQAGSAYSNFYGGFMTWEDFWNYVEDATSFGNGQYSIHEAKRIGYQTYLKKNYTMKEINEAYGDDDLFQKVDQVYIPRKNQNAYRLFYEFYDDYLNCLLADTQAVFPNLSMEVRLDVDPVDALEGDGKVGVPHYQTFGCGNSEFTSLMYSVSMGRDFGQLITASEAIETMNEQLEIVRLHNGGKPIFIDQLLYTDATEGFEHNARLHASHMGAYLTGIPDTLRRYTNGYAIWTYRNYANNPVYNSQFALGSKGWTVSGGKAAERNDSSQMLLSAGGSLSQKVGHRISGRNTHENHVRFTADCDGTALITVSLGRNSRQIEVQGKQEYDLNFGPVSYYEVSFSTDADVYLDNIEVYNFVQDGQLYDMDGNELGCLGAIRTLNAAMN
ncbi:MAG: hypothetical protein PHV18_14965 [Lachnospiraceae bacterium]|nr:hypothetical protein [Lachnospiraceae bacterium]